MAAQQHQTLDALVSRVFTHAFRHLGARRRGQRSEKFSQHGAAPDGVREGYQVRLGGGHLARVRLAQLCHRPSVLSTYHELVETERLEPRDANVDGLDHASLGPLTGGTECVCARRCLAGPAAATHEQDPQGCLSLRLPLIVRRVLDALDDGPGKAVDARDAGAVERCRQRFGRFLDPLVHPHRRLELLDVVPLGLALGRRGGDLELRVVDDDRRAERGSAAGTNDEGVCFKAQHPVRAQEPPYLGERREDHPSERSLHHVGLGEELGDSGRGGRRGVPRYRRAEVVEDGVVRVDPERELGLCSLAARERREGPEERGYRGEAARLQRRDGRVGAGADATDDRLVGGPPEGFRRLRLDPERLVSDAGEGAFARAETSYNEPEAEKLG